MPQTPPAVSPAREGGADRVRGRLMAQSLMLLLDRVRGAREVLPHLAALERALMHGGAAVIGEFPAPALAKICTQLSSLPLPDNDSAMQDLQSRLLAALAATRSWREDAESDIERTVVIREISYSAFDAATQEQATTQNDESLSVDDAAH